MKVKTYKLYEFGELEEDVREKVIDNWRPCMVDYEWWDYTYDDFSRVCEIIGISLDRNEPCFSGFYSQGDGASFTGYYEYEKGCGKAIREYAPRDTELHAIVDNLIEVQKKHWYGLSACITRLRHSRYYHSNTMIVDVDYDAPNYQETQHDSVDTVQECMRDLAHWLYKRLEEEYEFITSDEAVVNSINAVENLFHKDGAIARSDYE